MRTLTLQNDFEEKREWYRYTIGRMLGAFAQVVGELPESYGEKAPTHPEIKNPETEPYYLWMMLNTMHQGDADITDGFEEAIEAMMEYLEI
jgi:hypothetical protein